MTWMNEWRDEQWGRRTCDLRGLSSWKRVPDVVLEGTVWVPHNLENWSRQPIIVLAKHPPSPPRHLTTSPPHHLTTSPPHHLTTSPPHHLTTSPPHHLTTSPPHHLSTSPPHHLTTTSPSSFCGLTIPWNLLLLPPVISHFTSLAYCICVGNGSCSVLYDDQHNDIDGAGGAGRRDW